MAWVDTLTVVFEELRRRQHGVVSRQQALACGLSLKVIESRLRSGRWQRLHPGVFATFTGRPQRLSQLWAAVLKAGRGATLSHETAAELAGLVDAAAGPTPIHVTVPVRRQPRPVPGTVIHQSSRVDIARHPTRLPPQTRIEETVVDLTQSARTIDQAVDWIARAVSARLTTTARVHQALASRPKVRWRRQLNEALDHVRSGCHSLLELRYQRDVEAAHGLPRGQRQVPAMGLAGRIYHDVEYKRFRTVVELDGRAAHPEPEKWRDMRRDNASVVAGRYVLRYGQGDVHEHPCQVALQAAHVFQANGWTGRPKRCSRVDCVIT